MYPATKESALLLDAIAAIIEVAEDHLLHHLRNKVKDGFEAYESAAKTTFATRFPSIDWSNAESKLAISESLRSWKIFLFIEEPGYLDKAGRNPVLMALQERAFKGLPPNWWTTALPTWASPAENATSPRLSSLDDSQWSPFSNEMSVFDRGAISSTPRLPVLTITDADGSS